MSQVQIQNQKDLHQELEQHKSVSYSSEVSITTESEEQVVEKLSEMKNKNSYLTKIGVYFLIHSLFALGVVLFIKFDLRNAKIYYRRFSLDSARIYLLIASILIKIVFGFVSKFTKFLNLFVFVIDSILLALITWSLYFYLEEYKRIYYIQNGYFMAIFAIGFCAMSFAFLISTFIPNKKMIYNYWIGIILMVLAALISLKIVDEFWLPSSIAFYHYMISLCFMTLWLLYVPLNAFLIVNFRGEKLNSDDALVSYFGYWVDWFSFFWAEIFLNIKFVKKKLKKRNRKQRRKLKAKLKAQKQQDGNQVADQVGENQIDNDLEKNQNSIVQRQNEEEKRAAQKKRDIVNEIEDINDDFLFADKESNEKSQKNQSDDKVKKSDEPRRKSPVLEEDKIDDHKNSEKEFIEYSGTNPTDNIK